MRRKLLFLPLVLCAGIAHLHAQVQANNKINKTSLHYSIRAGISREHLKGTGIGHDPMRFATPRNLSISAAVDLEHPDLKSFVFKFECTYRRQHTQAGAVVPLEGSYKHDMKWATITPEVAVYYKAPMLWKLRLMAGIGLGWNQRKIISNQFTWYDTDGIATKTMPEAMEIRRGELATNLCAAILLANRVELNVKYWRAGMIGRSDVYNMRSKSTILSAGYWF